MSTRDERADGGAEDVPFWMGEPFWNRLNRVESYHLQLLSRHETARRELAAVRNTRQDEFPGLWQRYCEVIQELDRTTAELETLRNRPE